MGPASSERRPTSNWRRGLKLLRALSGVALAFLAAVVFYLDSNRPGTAAGEDWARIVGFRAFAILPAILGLAALAGSMRCAGILLAGLRQSARRPPRPARARFAERWYVPAALGTFSVALLLCAIAMISVGIAQIVRQGNPDSAGIAILVGSVLVVFFFLSLGALPFIRQPRDVLAIDDRGVMANWMDPPLIAWPEIDEIRVIPGASRSSDPDSDIVLLALRRSHVHWTSQVCVVDMEGQFGRPVDELLAILDKVRPSRVPLHDPRRPDPEQGRRATATPLARTEPADPPSAPYRRNVSSRWRSIQLLLRTALLLALAAGGYWIAVAPWLHLPDDLDLYAERDRNGKLAAALTTFGSLFAIATTLTIIAIGNFVRSRRRREVDAAPAEGTHMSDDGGVVLAQQVQRPRSKPVLRRLIALAALVPIATGVVAIAWYRSGLGVVSILLGAGMLIAVALSMVGRRLSGRRPPKHQRTLAVDAAGLHLDSPLRFLLPWWAIGVIAVHPDRYGDAGPESHLIDVFPRQPRRAPKILLRFGRGPKARGIGIRDTNSSLLTIRPQVELGLSPTVILDALERFRPPDVPIHDPRRIVEDGRT